MAMMRHLPLDFFKPAVASTQPGGISEWNLAVEDLVMGTPHRTLTDRFHNFAKRLAGDVGSPWAFMLALAMVIAWFATGSLFNFSDTWQLVINTGTTIVTFLMVFLIQNTQNRDAKAIHLKLDELIHGVKGARNALIDLEELSEEDLDKLQQQFVQLRR